MKGTFIATTSVENGPRVAVAVSIHEDGTLTARRGQSIKHFTDYAGFAEWLLRTAEIEHSQKHAAVVGNGKY